MSEPIYEDLVWERVVREEPRPCGCPVDYHLADCPILTSEPDEPPDPDDWYEGDY